MVEVGTMQPHHVMIAELSAGEVECVCSSIIDMVDVRVEYTIMAVYGCTGGVVRREQAKDGGREESVAVVEPL